MAGEGSVNAGRRSNAGEDAAGKESMLVSSEGCRIAAGEGSGSAGQDAARRSMLISSGGCRLRQGVGSDAGGGAMQGYIQAHFLSRVQGKVWMSAQVQHPFLLLEKNAGLKQEGL